VKKDLGLYETEQLCRLSPFFTSFYSPRAANFLQYTGSWTGKDYRFFWQRGIFCLDHLRKYYNMVVSLMWLVKLLYVTHIPSDKRYAYFQALERSICAFITEIRRHQPEVTKKLKALLDYTFDSAFSK
jgi:hypothetical protein